MKVIPSSMVGRIHWKNRKLPITLFSTSPKSKVFPLTFSHRYYANVYMHFEPIGYSYELKENYYHSHPDDVSNSDLAKSLFDKALEKQSQQSLQKVLNNKYPAYASLEANDMNRWTQNFIFHREQEPETPGVTTKAHTVAATGDLEALKRIVDKDPTVLEKADKNGWKPIHEAARAGKAEVLEYLIAQGVDINARTHDGKGASALWWAEKRNHHASVELLKKHGAVSISPKDD
jgi:hypothetical protein